MRAWRGVLSWSCNPFSVAWGGGRQCPVPDGQRRCALGRAILRRSGCLFRGGGTGIVESDFTTAAPALPPGLQNHPSVPDITTALGIPDDFMRLHIYGRPYRVSVPVRRKKVPCRGSLASPSSSPVQVPAWAALPPSRSPRKKAS